MFVLGKNVYLPLYTPVKVGYAFHGHVFMIFEFLLFSFHKHGLVKVIQVNFNNSLRYLVILNE